MTLLQLLVKKGVLKKEKAAALEYEIKTSGRPAEEIILERKIVSEEFLFRLKSENLKIPLKKIDPEEVPSKVLKIITEKSARYYKIIALAKKDSVVEVGMIYPEDLKAQEALKFLARQGKFSYKIFLITPSTFEALLRKRRTLKIEVRRALEELEAELGKKVKVPRAAEFERLVAKAPITKVVAVILRHAVMGRASDIHIEPTRKKLRVRFRMDGILHSSILLPIRIHPAIIARIKILANLKLDETRIPQDGRFPTTIEGKEVDFRVSTFPTLLGEKVAIRVLLPAEGLKSLEELGLEERNYKVLKKTIQKPFGLILSTGPTGCGKTTTLYAMLSLLNKEGVNVMTLEDPVEYHIEGINQSQIKPEIGYTYVKGLRHVLRQDPDIIMVGEIRDVESAALATHAALTGHLVLSTMHTANALGVIPRLIDLEVSPFLIPPSLSLALAQRLVRRLCNHCKKKVTPKPKTKKIILKEIELLPSSIKKKISLPKQFKIWKPQGCKKCRLEGYSGRIAVFEILEMTDRLSGIITKKPTESNIAKEAKRQGMTTMRQDGIIKVLNGVTSMEEVMRVAGKE